MWPPRGGVSKLNMASPLVSDVKRLKQSMIVITLAILSREITGLSMHVGVSKTLKVSRVHTSTCKLIGCQSVVVYHLLGILRTPRPV